MRIIYAYESDAADVNVQSGHPCSILRQLERLGHDVLRVFPLRQGARYLFSWKYGRYARQGQVYRPDREPLYLKSLARQIERRTRHVEADFLFGPGSHVVAELDSPHPKIFTADATFANVLGFYDSFERCAPEFIRQGHEQDRKALANCAAAIYPSAWAARSAIEDYGAPPDKVHVVPFGANVEAPPKEVVEAWVERRTSARLRLLFIGRDWARKGGATVLAAGAVLRRRGVPLRLDIVGVEEVPAELPEWAQLHGPLAKDDPAQYRTFCELLRQAHVLFVPSIAENYGMVFCEAAAFGIPSVATTVGGIPTIVRHRETGFTLAPDAPPERYADVLEELFTDRDLYRRLASAALDDYHARLTWESFAAAVVAIAEQVRQ